MGQHKKSLTVECRNPACGELFTARAYYIVTGRRKYCSKACYDATRPLVGFWRHGLSRSRLKNIYIKMKARCYNSKTEGYKNYGGRGITVCEEWRTNASAFFAWALANGYKSGLQIDRNNNDDGYSPDNCRWTTPLLNQNNRSNNTRIEYNGENLTLADWSRRTGINQRTLAKRLYRGWTGAEALGFAIHVRTWKRKTTARSV